MQVLAIRFCHVSPEAEAMADTFKALGLPQRSLDDVFPPGTPGFMGAIFLAGASWVELWPQGPEMPSGTMLQVVVDDADAFAAHARGNGLAPEGPMDMHGERVFFLKLPGGLQLSFQSALQP
jgi:hypothetical protein